MLDGFMVFNDENVKSVEMFHFLLQSLGQCLLSPGKSELPLQKQELKNKL